MRFVRCPSYPSSLHRANLSKVFRFPSKYKASANARRIMAWDPTGEARLLPFGDLYLPGLLE